MFSRSALVIFGLLVAEYFAAAWVVGQIGFGSTLLLLLLFMILGVAVTRQQSAGLLVSTLASAADPSTDSSTAVAGRFLGLIAGVLIGFPGFVTTAVGAVLLIPPVRKAVEPRLAARASSWSVPFINRSGSLHDARRPGRRGPSGDGTIIDVDLVDRAHPDGRNAGDVADVPRSARPELG